MSSWHKITIAQLSHQQQLKFWQLGQNIRCPSCRAQSILESNTPESVALRDKLIDLLANNTNEKTIVTLMQQEAGSENVTMVSQDFSLLLWVLPMLIIFIYFLSVALWRKSTLRRV